MKKLSVILLAITLVIGSLTGCGGNTSSEPAVEPEEGKAAEVETITLEIAFNQNEAHPQYKAMKAFGDALFERTNGAYAVEIFPNELLGAQKETVEMVQSGTIAMSLAGGSLMENWNPDFCVFNLPYVFDSIDQQRAIVNDPEIVGDLYESTADQGIVVIAAFHGGVRNVYTNVGPINTPADLKGLQIRVMQSDTNLKMMELMGGIGIAMGQGEVYTAVQTGVLDGGENNELIYSSLLHTEVAPYYSYTQHLMLPDYLVINTDIWNEMPDDVKTIFKEELAEAVNYEYDVFAEDVEAAKQVAADAGAQFNDADMAAFQEAVAPLTESKLTTYVTKNIDEAIRAWK
ncbi:MAG: TRAP transporter substrate-binding protein [Sedimentibacter sp.]